MEKIKTIALVIVSILLIATSMRADLKVLGSTTNDGIYQSVNVTSAYATGTVSTVIKGGGGVLGSVVIASSSNKVISVLDGSTSASSSGTLIAKFPVGAPAGTYTFDVAVVKGIVVDVPASAVGDYVITYR